MDKKKIKQQVTKLLNSGTQKNEVFKTLSDGATKDNQLALLIASHPNPQLYNQYHRKITALVTIMFIQALLAARIGFGIGAGIGPTATWVFVFICAIIPLLLAFGFYKNHAGSYNAYIILTIIPLPKMTIEIFFKQNSTGIIILAINIALLAYVWHTRSLLFPDFSFINPKKIKGQYVFSD